MPDIRTEALKVMHSWSKPEGELSSSTNPLGKQMWEWLKKYPNSTIKQICAAFPEQKDSSVATGLKSLVDRGILARRSIEITNYAGMGRKDQFIYRVISPEYKTQIKGYSSVKKDKKVKVERTTIEARPFIPHLDLHAETYRAPRVPIFDAEELINTLTLQQAKDVYLVLKAVFR
jgi:predicted transcriptional regulator